MNEILKEIREDTFKILSIMMLFLLIVCGWLITNHKCDEVSIINNRKAPVDTVWLNENDYIYNDSTKKAIHINDNNYIIKYYKSR